MKNRLILVLIVCSNLSLTAFGYSQPDSNRLSPEEYISTFRDAAIADMKQTGVPASITLAQGMYESDNGNSPLAKEAKNHFGIKCHKEWNGPTFHQDDDEKNECFRKYKTVQESYEDHSYFLRSRDRYNFLFDLKITDYKGWAHGLKKAGYATNPGYADKIIELIERYKLQEYDETGKPMPVVNQATAENSIKNKNKGVLVETEVKPRAIPKKTNPASISGTEINNVPFVKAKKGDSWVKISREQELELWQILEFNDAEKNDVLHDGEIVFLKAKKNHADAGEHIVAQNETMREIAQLYGIKLKRLYRMNMMTYGTQPKPGDKILLKRTMLFGLPL